MRKELAKARELLDDQEAGRSTQIIDLSEWSFPLEDDYVSM